MSDDRIAYGARCTWWGPIQEVGSKDGTPTGLPCCPHCGGVLFEVENDAVWWAGVDRHEEDVQPGYRDLITWSRGKCFPDFDALRAAHAEATA